MKKVMMTVFKIVLILIAVVVVGVVALILFALHKESNYYKYTEAVGEIEQKYTAFGDKEVSCQEYDANDDVIGKYAVWYPSELESSNTQYPVVIFANGTGSTLSTYKPFLTHLSSWGFISVGNDDENTRTGASLEETIKFLIAENEKKDSIFYHKIDLDNIGIAGHSQGGPAVFNMVTNQEHGSMVKALYAASATSSYHTMVMADGWEYDISRVNIPTFLTAGTGSWDAGNATSKEQVTDDKNGVAQGICPLWSLQENYSLLPETVDKVIARKKNVDHGDSYKQFDGYMTAWFVYHLQGDTEIAKPQAPDLVSLLNAYYTQRRAGAYSQKGKVSNLKEMNETFNYLRANGIYSLEDLEHRVSEHSAATESLKKTLDEQTARMKAIKRLYDSWARTVPVFEDLDAWGNDRNKEFVVDRSHPGIIDLFVDMVRHEYLLTQPLTKDDIRAEAARILSAFQAARGPNSPSGTHFMVQVSPDFLARANSKNQNRLVSMLPFRSLSISTLEGRKGVYALITKDEDRAQSLRLRKPSVRKKLSETKAEPGHTDKKKVREQER